MSERDPEGAQPTDIRPEIAEDFTRLYRKALGILEGACDGEARYSELCKCGRRVQIGYPKVKEITDALRFLADQGIGRPSTQAATPAAPKLTGSVTNATDQELEAILNSPGSPPVGS